MKTRWLLLARVVVSVRWMIHTLSSPAWRKRSWGKSPEDDIMMVTKTGHLCFCHRASVLWRHRECKTTLKVRAAWRVSFSFTIISAHRADTLSSDAAERWWQRLNYLRTSTDISGHSSGRHFGWEKQSVWILLLNCDHTLFMSLVMMIKSIKTSCK